MAALFWSIFLHHPEAGDERACPPVSSPSELWCPCLCLAVFSLFDTLNAGTLVAPNPSNAMCPPAPSLAFPPVLLSSRCLLQLGRCPAAFPITELSSSVLPSLSSMCLSGLGLSSSALLELSVLQGLSSAGLGSSVSSSGASTSVLLGFPSPRFPKFRFLLSGSGSAASPSAWL